MDALHELKRHVQRAIAQAHVVDGQLETSASARVIAAARDLFAAVDHLAAIQTYVVAPAVEAKAELPPPEQATITVNGRPCPIKARFEHHGETAFIVETPQGTVRVSKTGEKI